LFTKKKENQLAFERKVLRTICGTNTVKPVHNGIVGARKIFRCGQVSVVDRFVNFSTSFEKIML
jgi:hypothetical protein